MTFGDGNALPAAVSEMREDVLAAAGSAAVGLEVVRKDGIRADVDDAGLIGDAVGGALRCSDDDADAKGDVAARAAEAGDSTPMDGKDDEITDRDDLPGTANPVVPGLVSSKSVMKRLNGEPMMHLKDSDDDDDDNDAEESRLPPPPKITLTGANPDAETGTIPDSDLALPPEYARASDEGLDRTPPMIASIVSTHADAAAAQDEQNSSTTNALGAAAASITTAARGDDDESLYPRSEPPIYFDADRVAANVFVKMLERVRRHFLFPLYVYSPIFGILVLFFGSPAGPPDAKVPGIVVLSCLYVALCAFIYVRYRMKVRRLQAFHASGLLAETPLDEITAAIVSNGLLTAAPLYDTDAQPIGESLPHYPTAVAEAARVRTATEADDASSVNTDVSHPSTSNINSDRRRIFRNTSNISLTPSLGSQPPHGTPSFLQSRSETVNLPRSASHNSLTSLSTSSIRRVLSPQRSFTDLGSTHPSALPVILPPNHIEFYERQRRDSAAASSLRRGQLQRVSSSTPLSSPTMSIVTTRPQSPGPGQASSSAHGTPTPLVTPLIAPGSPSASSISSATSNALGGRSGQPLFVALDVAPLNPVDALIASFSGPVFIGEAQLDEREADRARRDLVREQMREHFVLQERLEQRARARARRQERRAAAASGGTATTPAAAVVTTTTTSGLNADVNLSRAASFSIDGDGDASSMVSAAASSVGTPHIVMGAIASAAVNASEAGLDGTNAANGS